MQTEQISISASPSTGEDQFKKTPKNCPLIGQTLSRAVSRIARGKQFATNNTFPQNNLISQAVICVACGKQIKKKDADFHKFQAAQFNFFF